MTNTPYNRAEVAQRAAESKTNVPGTCQMWSREKAGAPSAGDQDRDGDADAVDGWLSEPVHARHPGDRNPPRGTMVAWSGGSNGNGHRAISMGGQGQVNIRSTDAGGSGHVATVDLGWIERNWGLHYLGWSSTCSGWNIPRVANEKPDPKPTGKLTRGARVDLAIHRLEVAARHAKGTRKKFLLRSVKVLKRINPWHSHRLTKQHQQDTK